MKGVDRGSEDFFLELCKHRYYNITISLHGERERERERERELRDPIKGKQSYIWLIHIFSIKRDMHVLNME